MSSPSLSGFQMQVVVGVADIAVSNNQGAILTTYALGSCLGITLYDPRTHVGGLLHVMLPDSGIDAAKAETRPARVVDTGLALLFREMAKLGVNRKRAICCVAGGAQFLDTKGFFNIGQRNYESLKKLSQSLGLRIHAESVGGLESRSLFLHLETGEVRIKMSGQTMESTLWKT
jgi:chemotaxis protein CheD